MEHTQSCAYQVLVALQITNGEHWWSLLILSSGHTLNPQLLTVQSLYIRVWEKVIPSLLDRMINVL